MQGQDEHARTQPAEDPQQVLHLWMARERETSCLQLRLQLDHEAIISQMEERLHELAESHLLAAGKEDYYFLLQVAPDEGEEHVDLLGQLTHHVVLLQCGRRAAWTHKHDVFRLASFRWFMFVFVLLLQRIKN